MKTDHVIAISLLIIALMQVIAFAWEVSKWKHGVQQRERKQSNPHTLSP